LFTLTPAILVTVRELVNIGDVRVHRNQGSRQMVNFLRSCVTSVCRVKSRTRTLDR